MHLATAQSWHAAGAGWGWDKIPAGVSTGASTAAVIALIWASFRLLLKLWMRTEGSRRAQSKTLDKLACGSSQAFIEAALGIPQFVSTRDGRDVRVYRQPGAWVVIESKDDRVFSYSITITTPDMYYATRTLTFGQLDLRLGRDTFAKADDRFSGEIFWTGARRTGYLRHYYFGDAGGEQNYWLSYNSSGSGDPDEVAAASRGEYRRGTYSPGSLEAGEHNRSPVDASRIVANTLTVLSPEGKPAEFLTRDTLGVEHDEVRLVSNAGAPTRRSEFERRWTRMWKT